MKTIELNSPKDTVNLAKSIAKQLKAGDVIFLYGGLGSGKTFFVKHLGKHLGVTEEIDSPSFVLLKEYYGGRIPLFHLDLFRLSVAVEVCCLGILDMLDSGITCIEWAELAESLIPCPAFKIRFEYDGIRRSAILEHR